MRNRMNEVKIEERYHSLTVPGDMYHLQPEVIAARKVNGIRFSSKEYLINYEAVLRGHNIQLKDDVLTLEDASSEAAISSPSTPNHKQNRRGPGI
ncbi:hypothetical protein [Wolbachia endosymbiont of Cylisticus convexus]|uniref:hypothetical protein n=1 Tax=Wolbachia endosymbiont of Cylisticus convexus TaxID=118728 RepID=UPI000DF6907D